MYDMIGRYHTHFILLHILVYVTMSHKNICNIHVGNKVTAQNKFDKHTKSLQKLPTL